MRVNNYSLDRKRYYEELVLNKIGIDFSVLNNVRNIWWQNPINDASLRLTREGFRFFAEKAKLPYHEITLSPDQTPTLKIMLQLERSFKEPYYLMNRAIRVFGEQDAIMLHLHGGNLVAYLTSLE